MSDFPEVGPLDDPNGELLGDSLAPGSWRLADYTRLGSWAAHEEARRRDIERAVGAQLAAQLVPSRREGIRVLVFTMRPGQAFYVADQRVDLTFADQDEVEFRTCGIRASFAYEEMHELRAPNGFTHEDVRVGARRAGNAVRVCVEAPTSIKVLREGLYEKSKQGQRPPPKGPNRVSVRDLK